MFKPLYRPLRTFLFDRNLYIAFHLNMIMHAGSLKEYNHIRSELSKPVMNAIIVAFDWDSSLEGPDFWSQVSRKWEIYYAFLQSGGSINV